MKSKKDQGNDFFKKEKYQQAVNSYTEYVKLNNPDNSKAYSNMALCHFKLKNYVDCVKACESALQMEPQNVKAQFRMYEAYRELRDRYGMLIAGQKFCKISKQEKQIQPIQKLLPKIKQELSYGFKKATDSSQSDQIMLKIVNELKEPSDVVKPKKEPLISLQSKWFRIEQLAKENRRVALNNARKFINEECKTPEEKEKFKKLMYNLSALGSIPKGVQKVATDEQTDSSEQDIKIEELEQYSEEKQRKARQAALKTAKSSGKKISNTDLSKKKEQSAVKQSSIKTLPSQKPANQTNQQKPQRSEAEKKQDPAKKPEPSKKSQQQKTQPKLQKPEKIPQSEDKWLDFVKLEDAQKLFHTHITQKIAKHVDQFVGLYDSLKHILQSNELDAYQKEAILSVTPKKLKKFGMLMKSYTGTEKQELVKLFSQNKLDNLLEKYQLKK